MMPELAKIYDRTFFQEWGKHHGTYVESACRITDVLYDYLKPKSVIDWGAGCGVYSYQFKLRGVRVVGIDGVLAPEEERFLVEIYRYDLTDPILESWGSFDVSLCLEVGEHIPEALLEPFLGNITRYSDTLVLSCAPPRQGGRHHLNEKPKRYWIEQLRAHRFRYNRKRTGDLIETFKAMKPRIEYAWMFEQISVYERMAGYLEESAQNT